MVEKFQNSKKRNRTLTLCKLKTLDYRIFRKIREKIKNASKGVSNKNSIITKFKE